MSVYVTLKAKASLDKIEKVKEILRETIPETRAFPGCEYINIHENLGSPGELMFYEKWESEESYRNYFNYRISSDVMVKLAGMLEGRPEVVQYELLDI